MKKKIIFVVIGIFIFTIGCQSRNKNLDNPFNQFNYYKEEYLNRYQNYQKMYPKLSINNVVVYVNIGLDKDFYSEVKESKFLNTNYLLVNKYNYLKPDYIPERLEVVDERFTSKKISLVHDARYSFEELCKEALKDGYIIRGISAYRSYKRQVELYNNYALKDGIKNADTYSARAGFSEHQTGLTIDVDNGITSYDNFKATKEYSWMLDNAYKYGFILRYPEGKENITGFISEAWHYRYVGIEIATYIHNNNLTFDEYFVKFIEK